MIKADAIDARVLVEDDKRVLVPPGILAKDRPSRTADTFGRTICGIVQKAGKGSRNGKDVRLYLIRSDQAINPSEDPAARMLCYVACSYHPEAELQEGDRVNILAKICRREVRLEDGSREKAFIAKWGEVLYNVRDGRHVYR
jgi:hypothetical protein